MSKILPIKSTLDEKYINETETITEPALEALISGGGSGGGIEVVRFSMTYDSATNTDVYSADKTYDELKQAIRDGKIIVGLDMGYEAAPDSYTPAVPLTCTADFNVGRFIFTGLMADNSIWPQLSVRTYVLGSDATVMFESHRLQSEIGLGNESENLYTGSPCLSVSAGASVEHKLLLTGWKSGMYHVGGVTKYGVTWDVKPISGNNVSFTVNADQNVWGDTMSGYVLSVDASGASAGDVSQAIVSATYENNMGSGYKYRRYMIVTVVVS